MLKSVIRQIISDVITSTLHIQQRRRVKPNINQLHVPSDQSRAAASDDMMDHISKVSLQRHSALHSLVSRICTIVTVVL
jgi:hypothetical protein